MSMSIFTCMETSLRRSPSTLKSVSMAFLMPATWASVRSCTFIEGATAAFSRIFLAELLPFIAIPLFLNLLRPVCYPASGEVVRRELHRDLVAWQYLNEVHPHLAGYVRQDLVPVFELHPEHRVGQSLDYRPLNLYCFFFGHLLSLLTAELNRGFHDFYRAESTSGPSSVIATVCSK